MNHFFVRAFQIMIGLGLTAMWAGMAIEVASAGKSLGGLLAIYGFLGMTYVCIMGLVVVMLGD